MAVTIAVMRAAGLTDAQIIDILEVAEKERTAKVREQNRIRQRNQRSRNAVTRDQRDVRDEFKERKVSTPSKERNTPPSLTSFVQSEGDRALGRQAGEILRSLPPQPDNAAEFHNAAEKVLRDSGMSVVREYQIDIGNNDIGRIDLAILDGTRAAVAIELDRRRPRAKSLEKLAKFGGYRIAVVRNCVVADEFLGMVDDVIAVEVCPSELPSAFDRFWEVYPRKVAKKAAARAFTKALRETSLDVILAAIARQSPKWAERGEPEFIPYPASWLNAGRWDDQINGEPKAPLPSDEEFERMRARYVKRQAEVL